MKIYIYILLAALLTSCSANYHLKRARYHERMAYAKGAEVKPDTIYADRVVSFPEERLDSLIEDTDLQDTMTVTENGVVTKVKVTEVIIKNPFPKVDTLKLPLRKKSYNVHVKTVCPPKYITIKQKVAVTKNYHTEAVNIIKWWWLLIALGIGYVIKMLWR